VTTGTETTWGGSLHSTLRILPPAPYLVPYLSCEGRTRGEVLAQLPFDVARSNDPAKTRPDDKRRREVQHMCEWTSCNSSSVTSELPPVVMATTTPAMSSRFIGRFPSKLALCRGRPGWPSTEPRKSALPR
jgi:hypothetical protein